MRTNLIALALSIILLSSCTNPDEKWVDLIGDNLDNWEQLNGKAQYRLFDGMIEGTTVLNSPNSFLCTKAHFDDFILEFEVMLDPSMNSGVQIRSHSIPEYRNGVVHGYQVEHDPLERAWSGGIYDESQRMWMYPLDRNPEGRKAFVNGQWNHFRVEAIGNSIRTWCNNIPCADLIDDMTSSGFIGLQVHGIGRDSAKIGKKVIWKNIRIITDDPEKYARTYQKVIQQNSYLVNKLSKRELEEGWKLLWDGNTSNGWRSLRSDSFPEKGWSIDNGIIQSNGNGGDIITISKYKNFELILDFMYSQGGNSGIKYFINGDPSRGNGFDIGCEFQILDDRNNPDAKMGVNGNHTLGSLYDILPPETKRDNGINNWNRARIIVNGSQVEHWLNNQMTVKYNRGTEDWRQMVAKSKYKNYDGFGEAEEGHILLQEHGWPISFRSIKIREI